jgi:CDP-diacylglycerol--glycerol-3-phosphate 3-phosphatidyltransferase
MKITWATRITILRILLVFPFVSCMLKINAPELDQNAQNTMRYIAIAIFVVMAASDGVDGFLARKNKQITKLGSFLDPIADKLLITCTCLLLVSKRAHVNDFWLPTTVVVFIIGKDLIILLGFVIVYFVTSSILISPAIIGKLATAIQLIMSVSILIAPEVSSIIPGWIWFVRFSWWSAAVTAFLTTLVYIYKGSRYIEQYEQMN